MFLVSGASYEASYKTSFQSDGFATYQESSIKSFVGIQLPQNYEMLVILGLLRIQGCPSLCFCINLIWLCSLREMSQTKLNQMKSRWKLHTRILWLEGLGSSVNCSHDRKSEKMREFFISQKPSLYCMMSKYICTCTVLERLGKA